MGDPLLPSSANVHHFERHFCTKERLPPQATQRYSFGFTGAPALLSQPRPRSRVFEILSNSVGPYVFSTNPSRGIRRPFTSSLDHSVPPSSHCHPPSLHGCQTRYLAHSLTLANPRELNALDATATGPNAVAHYHGLQHSLNPPTKKYNSSLSITAHNSRCAQVRRATKSVWMRTASKSSALPITTLPRNQNRAFTLMPLPPLPQVVTLRFP
ncbi:hypothetical protein M758_UG002000 [Ceratodon purpureus]|nr:hypothetical protein M758_UG002000 [Ceratodon purpureus]